MPRYLGFGVEAILNCAYYRVSPECYHRIYGEKGPELGELYDNTYKGATLDYSNCVYSIWTAK